MRDELWDRLGYAAQAGCRNLVLNSNGSLLNRFGNIDKVLNSPLKRFILSLDGFSKETFERIRVKGKRDEIYATVAELCRKRRKSKQQYPVIIAQFSLMEQNAHELEEFQAYWHTQGAEVKVRPMLEWGAVGTVRTDTITHDSTWRIACPWANNTCAIQADGSVVACVVDYEGKFKVGNVQEQSVKELWHMLGQRLRRLHREHRWDQLPAICQGCGDWQAVGAHYEEREQVPGTRPFWFYEKDEVRSQRSEVRSQK